MLDSTHQQRMPTRVAIALETKHNFTCPEMQTLAYAERCTFFLFLLFSSIWVASIRDKPALRPFLPTVTQPSSSARPAELASSSRTYLCNMCISFSLYNPFTTSKSLAALTHFLMTTHMSENRDGWLTMVRTWPKQNNEETKLRCSGTVTHVLRVL